MQILIERARRFAGFACLKDGQAVFEVFQPLYERIVRRSAKQNGPHLVSVHNETGIVTVIHRFNECPKPRGEVAHCDNLSFVHHGIQSEAFWQLAQPV